MRKCALLAIVAVFNLILSIESAPKSLDVEKSIRYDGAQLWSIQLTNENTKRIITDFETNFG